MCGVLGIVSTGVGVDREAAERALAAMSHRGPDASGLRVGRDRRIALGHARLAIIDPDGGHQPIANEDGSVVASVNGELYGYESIRRDLESRGHVFATGSDSEILVHLYEEMGTGCLSRLRGEFAFVLWDEERQLLFAARDRFGIKPLCYTETRDGIVVASEAKALFAFGIPAAWDERSFFVSASMQYVPLDSTLFAGVRQLRPGELLVHSRGKTLLKKYWDLDCLPSDGPEWIALEEEELAAEVLERLELAVRLRLRSDVPLAFHVSGGLDSSAVLALAARSGAKAPACFTVSFPGTPYDELDVSRTMARHVGAELVEVRASAAELLACLPEAVVFSEGLAVNGHLPAKFLLSRAVRNAGYKVALTGEGSDEIFAGYPHLRQDLLEAESGGAELESLVRELHASNRASAGIMLAEGETLPLSAVSTRLGFVPSFVAAKGAMGLRARAILSSDFVNEWSARLDPYALLMSSVDVDGQLAGRSRTDQSLYLWSKLALSNYILRTLGDGTEMASSIEGRVPFLDHELYDFVKRIPLRWKIRDGREKHVLREALRGIVTEEVRCRRKHPFVAPPLSSYAGSAVRDLLTGSEMAKVRFFDRDKLSRLAERLPTMSEHERSLWDPIVMMAISAAFLQKGLGL